ncbi:MAG TPA: universal stress protein [bacterium]|nr:universal stress protein [bacterium]
MISFKKILCPTDFSEFSYEALQRAIDMASQFKAELIVLHVVNPVPVAAGMTGYPGFNIPEYQKELAKHARENLDKLIKKRVPEKIRVKAEVALGNEADEIVRIAEEEDIDLIVIATHGRTGIQRLFFGSVTEKVLRHTQHPVLVIPVSESE